MASQRIPTSHWPPSDHPPYYINLVDPYTQPPVTLPTSLQHQGLSSEYAAVMMDKIDNLSYNISLLSAMCNELKDVCQRLSEMVSANEAHIPTIFLTSFENTREHAPVFFYSPPGPATTQETIGRTNTPTRIATVPPFWPPASPSTPQPMELPA